MNYNKLIFDYKCEDRIGVDLPKKEVDYKYSEKFDRVLSNRKINLPCASELEVVRHYTNLSFKNFGVETGFYPLGSCTMKYNPKINEVIASKSEFTSIHPLASEDDVQGSLRIGYELEELLKKVTGMDGICLNPFAGAHGELSSLMVIKQYHMNNKDYKRNKIIIPDSAHGTNPASSNVCGFEIINVASNAEGRVDVNELKKVLNDEVAGLMLTNPNTLGMFEKDILEITRLVHEAGGLVYYDGANLNALLGKVRPKDMGYDVLHLNLHKTFSTPHGGGGPGSGPIGCVEKLVKLLPAPIYTYDGKKYHLVEDKDSLGRVSSFYGNFGVYIKALAYLKTLGEENLANVSKMAVLNANYIKESLKDCYNIYTDEHCKHEVVFAGLKDANGVTTLDVAKRLLDYGYHAPTIYFPLIVDQALMVEPTESESKETLDEFINIMKVIAKEAKETPELVISAPHNTNIKRIDEVLAARHPILNYEELENEED